VSRTARDNGAPFRNLRHVVTLARHLSYSRAAEALGLTQPALTRSIQVVERAIDIRLFDRDRAGVRLTSQGQQFVERARALLPDVEDFDAHARRLATGDEGRIKFGMAPLPAWTLLPSALQERIGAVPGLSNDVVVRNVDALWPLLVSG
jgi:DNA-binding transcriptional LysR family regulator